MVGESPMKVKLLLPLPLPIVPLRIVPLPIVPLPILPRPLATSATDPCE